MKGLESNASNTIWNSYRGQTDAIFESPILNAGNAITDDDRRQGSAVKEDLTLNASEAVP